MATNYKGAGETVQWVNGTGGTVVAGGVCVVGGTTDACIGIAHDDILDTETGTVYIQGVFEVVKVTGAVIAQGEAVLWDDSAGNFDDNAATPASGDVLGGATAMEAAGSGVLVIDVLLTPGVGVITA